MEYLIVLNELFHNAKLYHFLLVQKGNIFTFCIMKINFGAAVK